MSIHLTADATGRRSRTPERDAIAASERLRSGELNRRKSRNMSLDSVSSAATKEMENDQLRQEKKNLEDEIGRIGKHLDEIRRESSLVIYLLLLEDLCYTACFTALLLVGPC